MTDRNLGRALLELDAATLAGKNDVTAQTAAILQGDRVRLRLLTWSTIAVWLLALLLISGDLVYFALLFPRQALLFQQIGARFCIRQCTFKPLDFGGESPWINREQWCAYGNFVVRLDLDGDHLA